MRNNISIKFQVIKKSWSRLSLWEHYIEILKKIYTIFLTQYWLLHLTAQTQRTSQF